MKPFLRLTLMLLLPLFGVSETVNQHLFEKGQRMAKVLCQQSKLPPLQPTYKEALLALHTSEACKGQSSKRMKMIAYGFIAHAHHHTQTPLSVPKEAKCPVCGMFVAPYPKWATMMLIDGKAHYFDGVKDMMKYYLFDGDFPYSRHAIEKIWVSDYYTLKRVDAKEAYFVVDADVYGPMGHELIAFATKKEAEGFLREHHGKAMVRFGEITPKMVMALDGITLESNE